MDAIWPLVGVVIGALLTFVFGRISANAAANREDARADKADGQRLAAIGREHAARALEIIRPARDASWKRAPEHGSADINTDDLRLDVAEAEIQLIPDPVLRPRLASVLNAVRSPWTLSNSSYAEGWPIETQREGLYLLREALAAYVREEPTPSEPDRLAKLAKANDAAYAERDQWEADQLKAEKEKLKSASVRGSAPAARAVPPKQKGRPRSSPG